MWHRQVSQLGTDVGREALRGRTPQCRHARGEPTELATQAGALGAQLFPPRVVIVELEQSVRRAPRPGQHLVDGGAVLAGERAELGAAVGDDGKPRRIRLHARCVGGQVRRDVGEEQVELQDPVGQPGEFAVVATHLLQGAAGDREQAEGVHVPGRILVTG